MADAYITVRRYPMLRFRAGVDWSHMKLAILNRLSQLAAATGHTLYIFSGYRTNAYSAAHGGFAGDPHTYGIAADVYVDKPGGKPIGSFYGVQTLAKYGLRSGNVKNFYQGKPDPEHVDLVGYGYDLQGVLTDKHGGPQYKAAAAQTQPAGTQIDTGTQPVGPVTPPPQTSAAPELTTPAILQPGSVSGTQSPAGTAGFWAKVLDQPSVSADTQQYAQMLGGHG